MKYFYHLLVTCLLIIACLFWIDSVTRYRDFTEKIEVELSEKELRIQQLEKEVRILKTDVNINKNGFSER